jgi:dienelactone hydrolase
MKSLTTNCVICLLIILLSCNQDDEGQAENEIITEERAEWMSIDGRNSFDIPALVVIPEGKGPYPAIVVLHGCGGLLSNVTGKVLERHFESWVEFGKENKVVMIFPDSFNPRGFSEFCAYAPPEDAVCSPAYERPKDVADVLIWLAEQAYVDTDRLGLLGFSHGGSTTIASLADTDLTTFQEREVRNDGITYVVPGPVPLPVGLGFKAGVAYYPGAGFYGYFEDDYLPNSPLLIHAASLDPLYTSGSTEELVEVALENGAHISTGNNVVLHVYEGASHSFDGATSGVDGEADQLARQRTIEWFKYHLKF